MKAFQIILALCCLILPFCVARPSSTNDKEMPALEDNANPAEDETQNNTDEQESSSQNTENSDGETEPETEAVADEAQTNQNSEENPEPAQSEADSEEGTKEAESVEQNSEGNESDSMNESPSQSKEATEETSQVEESIKPEAIPQTEKHNVTEATVNQPVVDQIPEPTTNSENIVPEKPSVADNQETVEKVTESKVENIKQQEESEDEASLNEEKIRGAFISSVKNDSESPKPQLKSNATVDSLTGSDESDHVVSEKAQEDALDRGEKAHDTFTSSQTNFELPPVNVSADNNNWVNISHWPFTYNFNESSGDEWDDEEEYLIDGCKYLRRKVYEDFGVNMTEKEIKETLSQIPKIQEKNDSEAEYYVDVVAGCLNPTTREGVNEENCGKIEEMVKSICTENPHCKGKGNEAAAAVLSKLRELYVSKDIAEVLEMVRLCAIQEFA
ncbi:hypothetical protein D915_005708 [Fasciola hepatica]|uniref:Uncharacterized protein n=1 Tax=Fasciola hepatica TaxID=6192 RepID=A0A4E0R9Y1_FASHE|nr:hypothetical protein D915_005708 [Fasciola hepatica]